MTHAPMPSHACLIGRSITLCMQVLLSRYSRSEDVVTGIATDKTAGPDMARLIGLDCNPIALRTSFAGIPPISPIHGPL